MSYSSSPLVLGNRYRLGPLLGQGASGSVYEALDLMLGRTIAIKCMKLPEGADAAVRAQEFVAEAQTLARLDHPHIVDIHDVGIDETGRPYFVMALVERSLRDVLRVRGALDVEEVLELVLPLCGALACAHDLGIIHCDLKPENIAVHRVGVDGMRGKLLDFSIARHSSSSSSSGDGSRPFIVGTPGYMAPEQIRFDRCGPRSDVWSLAVVAFECLTLQLPFEDEHAATLLQRTVTDAPPSLAEFAPAVPLPIVLAIDRALATSPDRRYPDTRAFAQALVAAAAQAMVRVPDEPDPIGLPEMRRWRSESLVATAKLPVVLPKNVAPSLTQPGPPPSTAIDTTARGDSAARRARASRRLVLGLVVAALVPAALWQATRSSAVLLAPSSASAPVGARPLAPASRPAIAAPPETTPRTPRATSDVSPAAQTPPVPASTRQVVQPTSVETDRHGTTRDPLRSARLVPVADAGRATVDRPVVSVPQRAADADGGVSPVRRDRPKSESEPPPRGGSSATDELELKRDWEW